ncbi:hypothetical protein GFL96_17885 [Rhizobium leguminosarum bv. viciae]|nr:hypothetical protein [Rhizobium leguminosarum bv. viciae]
MEALRIYEMIYYNKAPDPTVGYDLVVRLDRIVERDEDLFQMFWDQGVLPDYFGWNVDALLDSIFLWKTKLNRKNILVDFVVNLAAPSRTKKALYQCLRRQIEIWRDEDGVFDVYFRSDPDGDVRKKVENSGRVITQAEWNERMSSRSKKRS